jgi:hypothetical protein
MSLRQVSYGLLLGAALSLTGCCTSKCGRPAAVSAFPPPCNTCPTGCPDGNCGAAPVAAAGVPAAPVPAYSVPPAAAIPNGYVR